MWRRRKKLVEWAVTLEVMRQGVWRTQRAIIKAVTEGEARRKGEDCRSLDGACWRVKEVRRATDNDIKEAGERKTVDEVFGIRYASEVDVLD